MPYLLLTLAYIVSGKLGLMLALPPGYTSPIFPPAGIAVAAVLIGGKRTLPWIFIGSLLLNVWVGYSSNQQINTMDLWVASVIAVASILQAAIGGWGLRRLIGYPVSFDHSGEVLRFLLLAPVICLTSASLSVSGLWTLGIVESSSFATNWVAWWVGDTFGVIVTLPLVMTIAAEPRALWRGRMFTVTIPILLIFALFVAIFLKVNQWEYNDSLSDFRQYSQQAANQVQTKLEEQEALLEQMAGLFIQDANGLVTRDKFHRFVEKSLNRFSMIQALEWAPEVDKAHRASFEAAQRKELPGFEIRERNAEGELRRAGERISFYPVTYVEPRAGNEPAIGFDLASNPKRQTALTKALQNGTTIATAPVHLVQERQQQEGVLLLLAVNPHDHKSGVVLTVLRISDFMDKLLLNTHPMLYTRLIDLDEQEILYDNFLPETPHALYERTFDFGARHFRLETAPTPAYFKQHHGWQSWSVLAVGILGTGLLGALLLLGTGYTARIESQVEDRARKLKESESRFRNILDHAPIGMAIATLDGKIMQANQALCAMLGYQKEELEKLGVRELTFPEDMALTTAYLKPLQDGEIDFYRLEKRYLHKTGRIVWGLVASSIEKDECGSPLYNIVQIEDITERKQSDKALSESEERYRLLFDTTIDGVLLTAPDGKILAANPSACKMFQRTEEEIRQVGRNGIVDTSDPRLTKAVEERDRTGKFFGEITLIRKDGSKFPSEISTAVFKNKDGVTRTSMTIRDISERKNAEQALQRESEKNLALLRNASDGIHILDTEGNVIEASDSFCAMLGYRRDEIIGMNVSQWDAQFTENERIQAIKQQFANPGRSQFETLHRRKDGSIFEVEVSGFSLQLDGKPALFNSSRDITLRKQAENALHESEARFRVMLENDLVGIATVKDRIIEWANPAYEKLLGYEKGELHGVPARVIYTNDETYQEMGEKYLPAIKAGKIFRTEQKFLRKDGSQITVDLNGGILNPETGESLWIYVDITERKLAEEMIYRDRNFINAVLNTAGVLVIVINREGEIVRFNHAAEEFTGYTFDEVKNRPFFWDRFLLPEQRNGVRGVFEGIKNGKVAPYYENHWVRRDGTQRLFAWSNSLLSDKENQMEFVIAFGSDITERKQLEEKLKESELRYRTVADYTSDWEYWVLPDDTFNFVSPSCEQVCGYTPDEFYANTQLMTQIIHPDDLHLYVGHTHHMAANGMAEPLDFRIRTKGGETRWISHVCRPVSDPAGKYIGQRASNRDITARKQAEELIRNLAFYDTLTQLPNRRLLNDRFGQTMAASKRSGRYGALMFLDLDNFKPLNDTYGHDAGDLLLIEVAKRINSCVREVDTVARFGGDEFVVILGELEEDKAESTAQASIVAEKIRTTLAEPYRLTMKQDGKAEYAVDHHCTSSIGVVVFINHEATQEELFKWADMAMYQAKEDGRNLIRFFDSQGSRDTSKADHGATT